MTPCARKNLKQLTQTAQLRGLRWRAPRGDEPWRPGGSYGEIVLEGNDPVDHLDRFLRWLITAPGYTDPPAVDLHPAAKMKATMAVLKKRAGLPAHRSLRSACLGRPCLVASGLVLRGAVISQHG
jgi:hypothetical protein